ncbi:MAG: iron-containing alcohol dehydrogenase [Verrucomicrobia bacterium]|nr:iron-containing alcohol dehydrogenase [Verrucomicrobiota bacterium]
MQFEFSTAARIMFGPGTSRDIGAVAKSLGRRALIVVGRSLARSHRFLGSLESSQVECVSFHVPHEPTTRLVSAGAELAKAEQCEVVIAVGGGSVLDAAKAIAAIASNGGEVTDYLEVVGKGRSLSQPSLPWIAVPTTAGTGAEVTRNAVLASPEHRMKASLRSSFLAARAAIVDPELTHDLPPALTASTGLDALTQLIEPYVSHRANPITDGFCVEGLRRCARSLRRAFENGRETSAREDMSLASLLSGLALANAGLGAVHGFAAAIGGMFPAPHGAVCAALLPHVMAMNVRALRRREPQSAVLRRFDEIARLLTQNPAADTDAGIEWIRQLCAALEVAPLRVYGITPQYFPELIERTAKASSTKNNPIVLHPAELQEILTASI